MRVLFVCSGNICRSPMAAELLRARAPGLGLSHLVVDSAGTLGIDDAPASLAAVEALDEIGVDLRGHRSRGVVEADVRMADLVLVMDGSHRVELARLFPRDGVRVELVRAFELDPRPAADAPDLDDPVGRPVEVFRRQRDILLRCIDNLALHLKHARDG